MVLQRFARRDCVKRKSCALQRDGWMDRADRVTHDREMRLPALSAHYANAGLQKRHRDARAPSLALLRGRRRSRSPALQLRRWTGRCGARETQRAQRPRQGPSRWLISTHDEPLSKFACIFSFYDLLLVPGCQQQRGGCISLPRAGRESRCSRRGVRPCFYLIPAFDAANRVPCYFTQECPLPAQGRTGRAARCSRSGRCPAARFS